MFPISNENVFFLFSLGIHLYCSFSSLIFTLFLSFVLFFLFLLPFARILHPFFLLFVVILPDEGEKEKDENTEEIMLTIFMYYYPSRLRIGNTSYTIDNKVALRIQPVSTRDLFSFFFLFFSFSFFFRRCYFWILAIVHLH